MICKLVRFITFFFLSGAVLSEGLSFSDRVSMDDNLNIKQPYSIRHTEILPLVSSKNGLEYDLYIKLPPTYDKSDKEYPILVLTDSTYAFPLVSSITHRLHYGYTGLEDIIIVGISYAKGINSQVSRTSDYTPTHSPSERNGHSDEAKAMSGRAGDFIDFIAKDVFSALEEQYRVDMNRRVFAGHSFGGLLANYMLLTRPDTFDIYLSGSPSIWYDNRVILEMEAEYAKQNKNLAAKLYMATGDQEEYSSNKMVSDMRRFEEQLASRNYADLTLEAVTLTDENHDTSYSNFITKGILWAFEHGR